MGNMRGAMKGESIGPLLGYETVGKKGGRKKGKRHGFGYDRQSGTDFLGSFTSASRVNGLS